MDGSRFDAVTRSLAADGPRSRRRFLVALAGAATAGAVALRPGASRAYAPPSRNVTPPTNCTSDANCTRFQFCDTALGICKNKNRY